MIRLPDWEIRLHDYLVATATAVFGYDHSRNPEHLDCCVFASGAVEALTGQDPIPEFRGRYSTEFGAQRALLKYGAGTLEATLDAKFEERGVAFARRGDLVFSQGAVGLCLGATGRFLTEADGGGFHDVPRAEWAKSWSIG